MESISEQVKKFISIGYDHGHGYGSNCGHGNIYNKVPAYGSGGFYGNGYGNGTGNGGGFFDGSGYGSGDGRGIKSYNGHNVYTIDYTQTIIYLEIVLMEPY